MTDWEILNKCIDLENSYLTKEEKKEVMEMLYKHREAFSLRDEIGTCPNIEVEIDVTDKYPFFIKPYNVREEEKAFIDNEMKQLCYMGILKDDTSFFLFYTKSSLVSQVLLCDRFKNLKS